MENDLTTLHSTLDSAKAAQGSEDYKKALESANSVKDQATSIANQIEEAKKKHAGAKPAAKTGTKTGTKKK
jgi:hypothetical protein